MEGPAHRWSLASGGAAQAPECPGEAGGRGSLPNGPDHSAAEAMAGPDRASLFRRARTANMLNSIGHTHNAG